MDNSYKLNKTMIRDNGNLPNFLGIGAQRAATTWLFECLREHPEIFVPPQKEIHFFDTNFDKGLDWYKTFFEKVNREKAVGEITPNYYHKPFVIDRIAQTIPDVKLIFSIRNPVDRAYSAYKLYHKHFNGISFEEAFSRSSELRNLGLYSKYLKYILSLFPEDKILIMLYDDIINSPDKTVMTVYRFLGVDPGFKPKCIHQRYNRIIWPDLQSFLKRMGLGPMVEYIKRTELGAFIKKFHASYANKAALPSSRKGRQKMIGFYKDDIIHLQELTSLDLSHWLR